LTVILCGRAERVHATGTNSVNPQIEEIAESQYHWRSTA
jgi:hypothetical protein